MTFMFEELTKIENVNMKCNDMKKFLLSTFYLLLWNPSGAQEYVIKRRVNYYPDIFTIPPCNGDVSAKCKKMGGLKDQDCQCSCKEENSTTGVLLKSTFGFYDKQWKCTEIVKVRRHGDCSILFIHEEGSDSLTTITPHNTEYLENGNSGCVIKNSSYLGCNGTWIHLDSGLQRGFSLQNEDENDQVYTYGLSYDPLNQRTLRGRLIRLGIGCGSPDRPQNCVLFKIKGKLTCPISFPTSSSILPSTSIPSPSKTLLSRPSTSSPSKLSSTPVLDTVQQTQTSSPSSRVPRVSATLTIPVTVPTSYILPNPESSTSSTTSNPVSSGKNIVISNFRPTLTTTSKMIEDGKKGASKGNDNGGLIAGALAGVIGFVVVIAVIVVFWIRKKRDAVSKTTPVAENAGYVQGVDNSLTLTDHGQRSLDEEEYAYAYANSAPFVKTKKKDMVDNTNNIMQGLEPTCSVANRVYGRTEELNRPDSPPHHQAPIYNTLEEPDYVKLDKSRIEQLPNHGDGPSYDSSPNEPVYAKVDKGRKKGASENINEPLYNVLEGPETDHEHSTLEGLNDEPLCYNVPNGTHPESAPVYDVLERPEAPVYGYLEGQDPHVYGALDLRENQTTFDEDQGNEDMVYDSVGDIINDAEDIYQQLNQSGQRDSDVYQALSYPDKTMYLSELNEPISNA